MTGAANQRSSSEPLASPTHQVYCADARKLLPTFPAEVFSSVITSPPYWGMRTYGHANEIGREDDVTAYIAELVGVFREVRRTLRNDGVLWVVLGDAYTSGNRKYRAGDKKHKPRAMTYRPRTPEGLKQKELIGLPWRVAFALQADGWYLRTDIVWAKPNPMPETVLDRPHRAHEFLFMFAKSPRYFFDRHAFEHPELGESNYRRTVWTVAVGQRKSNHPAAFPLGLVNPCIISSTRPGDFVLDPFAGSACVGLSALRLGRRFVGIEVVEEFAREASESLADLDAQNRIRRVK